MRGGDLAAAAAERLGDAAADIEPAETRRRAQAARAAGFGGLEPVFDGGELDFESGVPRY